MICREKADPISVVRQQNISAVELLSHGIGGGGQIFMCVRGAVKEGNVLK